MLDIESARKRVRDLDLSAGCGIPRPIEDRLRDVACALLAVQAETLEWAMSRSMTRQIEAAAKRTRAALKRLEAQR